MVVCRSSHIRTGSLLQCSTMPASFRLLRARSPSVPSMLRGRPNTISSARLAAAVSQTLAATFRMTFSVIWGVMAVVSTSPGSQTASPVRLSP